MEALLAPLLEELRQHGIQIHFFTEESGDRKKALLLKVPEKAVSILRSQPRGMVVVMPDLYPKNRGFPHETFAELDRGIREKFRAAMQRKRINHPADLESRFKVFCFKHDLEALLLASPEALAARLGVLALPRTWGSAIEDVNHDRPPKRVVEDLFARRGQRYQDTVDAPVVLSNSSYRTVAEVCPQCFKPFVEMLTALRGDPGSMLS
jgi:hypothetical protein